MRLALGAIFLLGFLLTGCTQKMENPTCEIDSDCTMVSNGAYCVQGYCQLRDSSAQTESDTENTLQPPTLPEDES